MTLRSRKGSIAAEHLAALMVLFLGLLIPLANLAASFYRYGLVLQAVHNAAYFGATAKSWTATGSSQPVTTIVPQTISNFCNAEKGIKNPVITYRMLETELASGKVTRLADGAKLGSGQPKTGYIYSLECTLECDIDPFVTFSNGLVPQVPGMTSAYHARMSTNQLIENPSAMTL